MLGAGGVGRMFALECARQGARVTVAVRESGRERASELAREAQEKLGAELSVRGIDALDGRFSLLINGTPVGMYPNTDACPVPPALLDGVDTVFDCVYNPSETLLLRHARERGVKAVGGMEMLVWQAAIAHEIWHGTRFSDRAVGRIVEEMAAYLLLKEQTP
ncbi:MAG: shikimate dehydrogenase family protein [Anaerotruncus massiliensis (ex Togo et al. 2019)]